MATPSFGISPVGIAHVGIGLKMQHVDAMLNAADDATHGAAPVLGWVEVHPQNFFHAGGPTRAALRDVAQCYPVSFHSVGLSIGSAAGPMTAELEQLAALMNDVAPVRVSDHLSWSGNAHDALPDLLPLPYTPQLLDHFARGVDAVQQRLGRAMLIENPSRMLAFAGDTLSETDFLNRLCSLTGCGLLLDINNIIVSATNLGFAPQDWLDAIDLTHVGEVHLAGHSIEEHADGALAIDDHGSMVGDACWAMFDTVIAQRGAVPTLIEWDTDVPELSTLLSEAARAAAAIDAATVTVRAAA